MREVDLPLRHARSAKSEKGRIARGENHTPALRTSM
jgi:hypothetical protein